MIARSRTVIPQDAPLMVHFSGKADSRPRGLGAWGGRVLHLASLASHDLALRLGAPRPWIESLVTAVLESGARRVVLVGPDFRLFMGDADHNRRRFHQAMEHAGVQVTELALRRREHTPLALTA